MRHSCWWICSSIVIIPYLVCLFMSSWKVIDTIKILHVGLDFNKTRLKSAEAFNIIITILYKSLCVCMCVRLLTLIIQFSAWNCGNIRTHGRGFYVGLAPWAWFSIKRLKTILKRYHCCQQWHDRYVHTTCTPWKSAVFVKRKVGTSYPPFYWFPFLSSRVNRNRNIV